jgi:hypothetical protein
MKSFKEYLSECVRYGAPGQLACIGCNGYGWIRDPSEQPCPVEGYKMVTKLKCQKCNGSCIGEESDYINRYAEYVKTYIKSEIRKGHSEAIKVKLQEILTKEELDHLKKNYKEIL